MDDFLLDALKSGMTSKTLCIKSNDLLTDWREMTSKSQQSRQYQLIGYWAMKNYPALGRKFFGDTWKAFERQSIEVIDSEAMSSDAVDTAIMRKMKIRSLELNVCQSTVIKLRNFIETPNDVVDVGKKPLPISRKVKSFDIKVDHIEMCWKKLQYGSPPMSELQNDLNEPDLNGIITTEDEEGATSNQNDSQHLPAAKRLCAYATDSSISKERFSRNGYNLVPLVKRMSLDITTNTNDPCSPSASELIHASKQTQIDTNVAKDLTSDNETILLEMRSELDNLTQRLNSATLMKASDDSLRMENEILKEQIKANASLMNALQNGVDSSTKWYQMMELSFQKQVEDSTRKLAEAEKLQSELSRKNIAMKNELDDLKHFVSSSQKRSDHQIQDLTKHLVEADSVNFETTEKNSKLDQELSDLKQHLSHVETPLQDKIKHLSNNLSEAERLAVETSNENKKLKQDIAELKNHVSTVEASLQRKIQSLINSLSEAEKLTVGMSKKNANLEQELREVEQRAANIQSLYEKQLHDLQKNVEVSEKITKLEAEIDGLKNSVATKEKELIEASEAEKKLESLKDCAANMMKDLQNQIQSFEKDLADTQKKNIELTSKNDGLELELKRLKSDSASIVRVEDNERTSIALQAFFSNDPIVQECRDMLGNLSFGWMKFHKKKSAKYYPGFVHPADADGKCRAQSVTTNGYVSNQKNEYYDFHKSLSHTLKEKAEIYALNKFNEKFYFSFS